ncbi:hypothetical protein DSCO28_71130 [Desulfosarcina ovata subsp. sediminis]|uniref:PEP-CTERM protein-sorting domain-containing protein n=1 Tax=Desulfosarcina ovata subsp. sediminis TaxID=885957 RepID=A0A5K8A229_9BACT|nr:hypothetical protein [Desulfosarcina ovata]BBO86547.1 hypothetical protein DSCO28_71130 [Desulfosarcina ovata subsp. sediminis]
MKKKSNCQKTSEAYVKTNRNKAFGAMATAGAALLALNLSTDANAAIVSGTNFTVNGNPLTNPTLASSVRDRLVAFNGKASWSVGDRFSQYLGDPQMILTASIYAGGSWNVKILDSGYKISAGRYFAGYPYWTSNCGESGYMGIKFKISGSWHYGWIEASINAAGDEITLYSWAYEDVAGQPIDAGDTGSPVPIPGSLALLASGAAGLAALRRRKSGVA